MEPWAVHQEPFADTAFSDTEERGPGSRARPAADPALKQELVGGDLLTAAEVAEILDIHPRTVGEYIRDGKLRAFQFGGGWKISELALRAFVREQTQASRPPSAGPGASHPIARALDDVADVPPPRGGPAGAGRRRPAGRGRGAIPLLLLRQGPGARAPPDRRAEPIFICDALRRAVQPHPRRRGGAPGGRAGGRSRRPRQSTRPRGAPGGAGEPRGDSVRRGIRYVGARPRLLWRSVLGFALWLGLYLLGRPGAGRRGAGRTGLWPTRSVWASDWSAGAGSGGGAAPRPPAGRPAHPPRPAVDGGPARPATGQPGAPGGPRRGCGPGLGVAWLTLQVPLVVLLAAGGAPPALPRCCRLRPAAPLLLSRPASARRVRLRGGAGRGPRRRGPGPDLHRRALLRPRRRPAALPAAWLPRSLVVLSLGCDLLLLGVVIAALDAFDEGEALRPDLLRSAAGAALPPSCSGCRSACSCGTRGTAARRSPCCWSPPATASPCRRSPTPCRRPSTGWSSPTPPPCAGPAPGCAR